MVSLVGILVLSACGDAGSGSAVTSPEETPTSPPTSLTFSVDLGDGSAAQEWTRTCDPLGGSHPQPRPPARLWPTSTRRCSIRCLPIRCAPRSSAVRRQRRSAAPGTATRSTPRSPAATAARSPAGKRPSRSSAPVRRPRVRPELSHSTDQRRPSASIRTSSSDDNAKPITSQFAAIRSGLADLGMTTKPWSTCHRSTT